MDKKRFHSHDYLFIAAGVLLFMTLLSVWLLCGLYAKYTAGGGSAESARVAKFGTVAVIEHEASLKTPNQGQDLNDLYHKGEYADMVYKLDKDSEVETNSYSVLMPGVDIPKDPFVRVTTGEVACELYVELTEKDFPAPYVGSDGTEHKLVTYTLDENDWELLTEKGTNGGDVYKYKQIIPAGTKLKEIYILKDNKITVSQYYDADTYSAKTNNSFSLQFNAWIKQAD